MANGTTSMFKKYLVLVTDYDGGKIKRSKSISGSSMMLRHIRLVKTLSPTILFHFVTIALTQGSIKEWNTMVKAPLNRTE